MSVLAFDENAAGYAGRLEDRERFRHGVTLPVARASVARRLGVAPGTLERLRSGRIKGVRGWVAEKLHAAIIAELEADIARDTHELAILRAAPGRLAAEQAVEVEKGLAALRMLLRGDSGSTDHP